MRGDEKAAQTFLLQLAKNFTKMPKTRSFRQLIPPPWQIATDRPSALAAAGNMG